MRDKKQVWNFLTRWGPALVIMIVIFVFSSIPSEEMPNFGKLDLAVKKLGHMAGYAFLALAYLRAINTDKARDYFLAWFLTVLFAFSDELHQTFVPGRHASVLDVGVDSLGALLGLLLAALWRFIPQTPGRNHPPHPRFP